MFFPFLFGLGFVGPSSGTFRFPELLRSPDRRCPSPLQVVNLLSLARLSQLSLCPGLLTKARTQRPNSLPCSRREHYSISCGLCARGYTKKIFAGIISPAKCAKPLILLGLLISNMHADAGGDKKFFNFFVYRRPKAPPQGPSANTPHPLAQAFAPPPTPLPNSNSGLQLLTPLLFLLLFVAKIDKRRINSLILHDLHVLHGSTDFRAFCVFRG